MDIGRKLAALEKAVKELQRASRLSSASLDDAALVVRDGTGSLRGIVGQQGDGTTAVTIVNGPPPPQPSAPLVLSVIGGVAASWDGLFTDGVLPLDWSRVEVHASEDSGFTPTAVTLQSTIETAQGATVIVHTDDPVYVRLVARSTSGTASAPSAQTGPYGPEPVVAADLLDGTVTTLKLADDAVTAAKVAASAVTPEALAPVLADTVSQRWVDTMDDPAAWTVVSQDPGASWAHVPAADATTGGAGVGQATGYVSVRGTTLIPHDPATMYRISVRIRASAQPPAGADTVYLGLMGFAADKTTLVNRTGANSTGSQFYCVANLQTVTTASGWTVYTGFIQGRGAPSTAVGGGAAPDPLAPGLLHDQVRYMTPYLLLNYTRRDNAGIMQVDTVTVESLRTGVVTAAYLAAGSVSTSKLVAGAVQTLQLDAEAVNASKIAAGAVTTAKLDALAVTADKIAANTITAGKLAAGSVDATALKADAITGKTITGGTITGTTITGSTVQTATSGKRLVMTPDGHLLMFSGRAGGETPGELVTGINTDGEMELGYVVIKPPTHGPTPPEFTMSIGPSGEQQWFAGPLTLLADAGAAFVSVEGSLAVSHTTYSTYTPVVGNAGSATWAVRDGWYYKLGTMVFFQAYIAASGVGSGTTGITISLPSTPWRGPSANRRQYFGVYAGGIAAGTNSAVGGHSVGLIQPDGSGDQFDQVRGPTDIQIRGNNISATSTFTINGWYREV
ncbi:hypothetical protein [Streptomyces griseus]|uniref:hypothetical protein n=1 Tax=Streptomyces griseus TaxID=1911 RepID=UPI0036FC2849